MRSGKALIEQLGFDFAGLREAEVAVAVLAGPCVAVDDAGGLAVARLATGLPTPDAPGQLAAAFGVDLPPTATPDALATIGGRLRELTLRWRVLADGAAIKLDFPTRPM
jgi:hypothetical protein